VKKSIVITCLCVLLKAGGSLAAPPEPINTAADVSTNSIIHINGNFPLKHNQQRPKEGFTSGDMQLTASVMAGTSTCAAFEQIAFDKYVPALLKTETPAFNFDNFEKYSSLNAYSDFLTQDLPSQPLGAASTILELGTLPNANNDLAHNQTYIDISVPGAGLGFVYDSFANITELHAAESQWSELAGNRNITKNWNTLTYVGETINLFAGPDSNMLANLYVRRGFYR
jgi:hypothetical protein